MAHWEKVASLTDCLSLISGIRIIEERTDSCKFSSDHTHALWHTHAQTLTKENVIKIEKNVQVQDCFIADVG